MLLKIVATLIVAGLVAQSSGYVLKRLRNDFRIIPGFSYTSEKNADHDELSISAKEGDLTFSSFSRSHTAWSLHQVNGSSTISQEASDPFLDVIFPDVQASNGDAPNDDDWAWVEADLATATFDISLTATENDNKCALAVKIAKSKTGIELETLGVDNAFNAPAVVNALKAVIWGGLADVLPAALTDMLTHELKRKMDIDALCKQILAAKPEDFPKPQL